MLKLIKKDNLKKKKKNHHFEPPHFTIVHIAYPLACVAQFHNKLNNISIQLYIISIHFLFIYLFYIVVYISVKGYRMQKQANIGFMVFKIQVIIIIKKFITILKTMQLFVI